MATAALARPNTSYGMSSNYNNNYNTNVVGQMQPAQNPPLKQVPNTSNYGSVTYVAPGQVYTAQPVTYVAPQLTFNPPQVSYTGQTVVYAQPAADASGPQVLNMAQAAGNAYSAPAPAAPAPAY